VRHAVSLLGKTARPYTSASVPGWDVGRRGDGYAGGRQRKTEVVVGIVKLIHEPGGGCWSSAKSSRVVSATMPSWSATVASWHPDGKLQHKSR